MGNATIEYINKLCHHRSRLSTIPKSQLPPIVRFINFTKLRSTTVQMNESYKKHKDRLTLDGNTTSYHCNYDHHSSVSNGGSHNNDSNDVGERLMEHDNTK